MVEFVWPVVDWSRRFRRCSFSYYFEGTSQIAKRHLLEAATRHCTTRSLPKAVVPPDACPDPAPSARPRLGLSIGGPLNLQVERLEAVGEPAVHRSEKARGPQTRGPVRPGDLASMNLGRSNGWISLITAQQDRSQPVTLVDLRDQSFSGTSAAFSFDSTGAGASSAGAAAGLGDAGASSAGALSVKASIKVVFLAFDFRVGRRHADFRPRPLRKTLPMGPR